MTDGDFADPGTTSRSGARLTKGTRCRPGSGGLVPEVGMMKEAKHTKPGYGEEAKGGAA